MQQQQHDNAWFNQFRNSDPAHYLKHKLKEEKQDFTQDLTKLGEGLTLVQAQIEQEVKQKYEQYLDQMIGFGELQGEIGTVKKEVNALQLAVQRYNKKKKYLFTSRLQNNIGNAYQTVEQKVYQMNNTHQTTELLRTLQVFLRALCKLKSLSSASNTSELAKLGLTLQELGNNSSNNTMIEEILDSNQLQGIQVVDKEETWIRQQGIELREKANQSLANGLKNLVLCLVIPP